MKRLTMLALIGAMAASSAFAHETSGDPLLGSWVFVAISRDGKTLSTDVIDFNFALGNQQVLALSYGTSVTQAAGCVKSTHFRMLRYDCYADSPFAHWHFTVPRGSLVLDEVIGKLDDGTAIVGWRIDGIDP